tara:strand:+ start:3478 stop:3690 length:213 start_codon:yes stop_codon:yes gene_type:complete
MPSPLCESKWAKRQKINKRLNAMVEANPEMCFTRKEIADYCQVDVSTIRKIEKEALRKLWKKLNFLQEVK